jgi:hypothetical protein
MGGISVAQSTRHSKLRQAASTATCTSCQCLFLRLRGGQGSPVSTAGFGALSFALGCENPRAFGPETGQQCFLERHCRFARPWFGHDWNTAGEPTRHTFEWPNRHGFSGRRLFPTVSIDTLRFVLPYLEKPEYAQEACATIVELAHHRKLREPNKAEFDKALDAVILLCKDTDLVTRAKRYKKGQTWERRAQ